MMVRLKPSSVVGFIGVVSFMIAGSAIGQNAQPYDLKGDRLGMTLEDFRIVHLGKGSGSDVLPWCSDTRPGKEISTLLSETWYDQAGLINCRLDFPYQDLPGPTIAGVNTDMLIYHFVDGQLYQITAWLPHSGFSEVKNAYVEKLGRPTAEDASTYQNAFGAKFSGETLTWKNGVSAMLLVERNGSVNDSAIYFVHTALHKKAEGRKPKARVDDT
jgi:hypothetical protein